MLEKDKILWNQELNEGFKEVEMAGQIKEDAEL